MMKTLGDDENHSNLISDDPLHLLFVESLDASTDTTDDECRKHALQHEDDGSPLVTPSSWRQELLHNGYFVLRSIVTEAERNDAMELIGDFLHDTSYGAISKPHLHSSVVSNGRGVQPGTSTNEKCSEARCDNPNAAVNSSTLLTQHDHHPDGPLFETNGAGWLLSNLREVIADRVYAPLFGTSHLHSSKEGFFYQGAENAAPIMSPQVAEEECTLENQASGSANKECVSDDPPIVRCLVALMSNGIEAEHHNDRSDEPAFICYPYSHRCKESDSNITPLLHKVHLARGDAVVWRSDMVYSVIPATTSTVQPPAAFAFCAMQPARCSPNVASVAAGKLETYKQRQSTDFCLNDEQWRPTKTNSNGSVRTRPFFRTGPPLVSYRQAQLYGLLPWFDGIEFSDVSDDVKRALIQGVRFAPEVEPTRQHLVQPSMIANHTERSAAHLVHLTMDDNDTAILAGQDKYLGGMASPCGRYVFGVPGGAKRVLRIHVAEDGRMDFIGPAYDGKFKWLRGVDVPASAMSNDDDNRYPDGCCLALPCNAASILKINPATSEVYTFGEEVLKECGSDRWHYHGGNLASNGWLYAIPANAQRVLKFHPVTDEVMYIGPCFEGGQKWFGGIIGCDGCIYGIPHNERGTIDVAKRELMLYEYHIGPTNYRDVSCLLPMWKSAGVLKIDPRTDEVSLMVLENGDLLPAGQWKWHGGLRANDKIYGFPNNANTVLVVNCRQQRVYTVGDDSILQSGRHRIPQDNRYKYLGGATTLDKRFAYLFPCDAERVLRINCETDELSLVGPLLLDGENKFQNGFSARGDGCLYGIPQRASGVLRIIPGSLTSSGDDHVDVMDCGPELIGVKDKFEGGVLGSDGCIYCIPLRSRTCVKVVPAQWAAS